MKASTSSLLLPPTVVQGMTSLDKDLFKKTIQVVSLTVGEKRVGELVKTLKQHLIHMRNIKNISKSPISGKRSFLLDPHKYQKVDVSQVILEQAGCVQKVLFTIRCNILFDLFLYIISPCLVVSKVHNEIG